MKLKLNVCLLVLAVGIFDNSGDATSLQGSAKGTILVEIVYPHALELLTQYEPQLEITLLADDEALMGRIHALQERSKPELEPVVKQYMYAAEALNQIRTGKIPQQQQTQLMQSFTAAEKRIQQALERYTPLITDLLQRHTCQKIHKMPPLAALTLTVKDVAPGRYRVYGVLTYATTTLTWFEPVHIEGGERRTITLTRDNLHNPYWTELNWWSFINLDFSKHH